MDRQDDDDPQLNDLIKSMHTLQNSAYCNFLQSGSISIVPEGLKQSNGDAYMPRVVSIGPRFKGSREDLLFMEEVKLDCMIDLLLQAGGDIDKYLKDCSRAIWELDELVRARYMADIKLEKHELAKIMLVDGFFLLELLVCKDYELGGQFRDRIIPMGPAPEVLTNEDVLSDLMLLENQIPIFVIQELSGILFPNVFKLADGGPRATKINNLVPSVLGYSLQPQVESLEVEDTDHILDIVHVFVNRKAESEKENSEDFNHVVVDIVDPPKSNYVKLELKRCALRLLTGGISIKLPDDTDSVVLSLSCFSLLRNCLSGILTRLGDIFVTTKHTDLDMPAEYLRGLDFKFKFEKGKLEIAQLHITKTTKAKWLNVIAWEHHRKKQKKISPNGKFTSAALIFNGLICSVDDVQLLKDKNIIVDHLKMSNDELLAFFRTISLGVNHGVVDSSFIKMVDDLNKYSPPIFLIRIWKKVSLSFAYRQEWLIRFMNRNYNFVATVLAVLTIVQTVYAVLAYYLPK